MPDESNTPGTGPPCPRGRRPTGPGLGTETGRGWGAGHLVATPGPSSLHVPFTLGGSQHKQHGYYLGWGSPGQGLLGGGGLIPEFAGWESRSRTHVCVWMGAFYVEVVLRGVYLVLMDTK